MKKNVPVTIFLLIFFSTKLYPQVPEQLFDSALVCKLKIESIRILESDKIIRQLIFDEKCRLTNDSSESATNSFRYDSIGRLKVRVIGSWVNESYKYLNDTVKTSLRIDANGTYLTKETYYKKRNSKIITEHKVNSMHFYDSTIYNYDKNEKLLERRKVSPYFFLTKKYYYDSMGKLTKTTTKSSEHDTYTTYSYDTTGKNNRVTETYYNANGNLIEFTISKLYDERNRLVEYKNRYLEVYSYKYDSLNRLSLSEKLGSVSGFKTIKKYSYANNGTIDKIEITFSKKDKFIEKSAQEFFYKYY